MYLPLVICEIISSYACEYKMINWIYQELKYIQPKLSLNRNAVDFLIKYPSHINWNMISDNINALHIIKQNIDKINWYRLCSNTNAIELLKKYPAHI